MGQSADLIVTAHLQISIPEGMELVDAMMEVTKKVESVLNLANRQGALEPKGIMIEVGKVLGAAMPKT